MADLWVIGLGPGDPDLLPVGALDHLHRAGRVFLRTERHPVVPFLAARGIEWEGLDFLYDREDTFEAVYRTMASVVVAAAGEAGEGSIAFAVPGHPLVGESATREILALAGERGVAVRILSAPSFLDALMTTLRLDPAAGLQVMDALDLSARKPRRGTPLVLFQVYDRQVASQVKLELMETYGDNHPVTVVTAAGVPGEERSATVPLFQLDREERFDHLTSLYVPPLPGGAEGEEDPFRRFAAIVRRLRAPGGCPWDREQTHRSLRPYVVEEAYEVVEAIDEGDDGRLAEELGDLLLQVVLHGVIAEEEGRFDLDGVIGGIAEKIVRRHPHVFGSARAETAGQVRQTWEQVKRREKAGRGFLPAPGDRVVPALMQAEDVQSKVAGVGFDWPTAEEAWAKVEEEAGEFRHAWQGGDPEEAEAELGDLLFAVVNVARLLNIPPEIALKKAVGKFTRRFNALEDRARRMGRSPENMTLEEMDNIWEQVKRAERSGNP